MSKKRSNIVDWIWICIACAILFFAVMLGAIAGNLIHSAVFAASNEGYIPNYIPSRELAVTEV